MRLLARLAAMTCALLAVVAAAGADPAVADTTEGYAAVACSGNHVVVRFAVQLNDEQPDFNKLVEHVPQSRGLSRSPEPFLFANPADCSTEDGHRYQLRESARGARTFGECGAQSDFLFSLSVDGRIIYEDAVWRPKCATRVLSEISIWDGRLTECWSDVEYDTTNVIALSCEDRSERLRTGGPARLDEPKLFVLRAAAGQRPFCESLIHSRVGGRAWPTSPGRIQEITADPLFYYPGNFAESVAKMSGIDRPMRVLRVGRGFGAGCEGIGVAALPLAMSELDANVALEPAQCLTPESTQALRSQGILVFAGDRTQFGRINRVTVSLFRAGSEWLLRADDQTDDDPGTLVLRAREDGAVDELCAFDWKRAVSP